MTVHSGPIYAPLVYGLRQTDRGLSRSLTLAESHVDGFTWTNAECENC